MPKRIVQRQSQTIYDDEYDRPRRRRPSNAIRTAIAILVAVGAFTLCWNLLPQMGLVHSANELTIASFVIALLLAMATKKAV